MSEIGLLAALPWGTATEPVADGGSSSQRISRLVRRAMVVLESDRQGARRCLDDALALLEPQRPERSSDDLVAGEVFQPGGLARWQARRAVTYIDGHLESRLDVQLLADLVSFSKSHFSRAFKQSLGLPPMTYVKMHRIERAKALMAASDQKLTEIALICGFADQSHLNRSFRRAIGVSPGRWRRTNLPTDQRRSASVLSSPDRSGVRALERPANTLVSVTRCASGG